MTEAEMYALWGYAHEAWQNFALPEPGSDAERMRATVWHDELADLPAQAIRDALHEPDLARREWFPPLGLIRERALLATARAAGVPLPPDTDVAWLEVGRQIRAVGHRGSPEWSHPAVAEAVAAVGWRVLCMGDEGDPMLFRQWRDFYALAAARHRDAVTPGPSLNGAGHLRGLPSGQD